MRRSKVEKYHADVWMEWRRLHFFCISSQHLANLKFHPCQSYVCLFKCHNEKHQIFASLLLFSGENCFQPNLWIVKWAWQTPSKALFELKKRTARIRRAQKITFGSVDLNGFDMRGVGVGKNDSHKSTQEGHSDKAGNYFNIYDPPNRHHRDNLSFFSAKWKASTAKLFSRFTGRCSSLSDY